jgi:hypothetical protein
MKPGSISSSGQPSAAAQNFPSGTGSAHEKVTLPM